MGLFYSFGFDLWLVDILQPFLDPTTVLRLIRVRSCLKRLRPPLVRSLPVIEWRLTHLSLPGCSLKRLSPEICQIETLQELHLANNELAEFPQCYFPRGLELLDLNRNRFTSITGFCWAAGVRLLSLTHNSLTHVPWPDLKEPHLTSLVCLTLCHNQISEIPAEWLKSDGSNKLKRLWLEDNPLESLPEVWYFPKLRQLHLSNCGLSSLPSAWAYPDAGLGNLGYLFVRFNQLKELPDEWGSFENAFPRLLEIHVTHNELNAIPDSWKSRIGISIYVTLDEPSKMRLPDGFCIGRLGAENSPVYKIS